MDGGELFEGSAEVFGDLLSDDVGIGEEGGVFRLSSRSQKRSRLTLSRWSSSS